MILRNATPEVRMFHSLCSALTGIVNGYHTMYHECIPWVLRIMNASQFGKNHMRIAVLKYIWLSVMKRIGIILYDTYVLTGYESCLFSAEVVLMFAQRTNVFGLFNLATLWYCKGIYKQCIKLIANATTNSTQVFLCYLCHQLTP